MLDKITKRAAEISEINVNERVAAVFCLCTISLSFSVFISSALCHSVVSVCACHVPLRAFHHSMGFHFMCRVGMCANVSKDEK